MTIKGQQIDLVKAIFGLMMTSILALGVWIVQTLNWHTVNLAQIQSEIHAVRQALAATVERQAVIDGAQDATLERHERRIDGLTPASSRGTP